MAKKQRQKKNGRALGKTQISISLPEDLLARVDAAAASERRNRSNFISDVLHDVLKGVK